MELIYRALLLFLICTNVHAGIDFAMLSEPEQTTLSTGVIVKHSGVEIIENEHMNTQGEHTYPMKEGWSIIDTSLYEVETALGVHLIEIIADLKDKYPDKEIVVIDWGCGRGKAINSLARQARHGNLKGVKFIGFSNLYFPMWSRTQGVEYIFDEMENLHKYFNSEQIGLIYSYFGLFHIDEVRLLKHLNTMSGYMVDDGVVITNFNHYKQGDMLDLSFKYMMDNTFTDGARILRLRKKHALGAGVRTSVKPVK